MAEDRRDDGADPGQLLSDLAGLRQRTRRNRHGYWFPLVLFGVLTAASTPLYIAGAARAAAQPSGEQTVSSAAPLLLGGSPGLNGFYIGWYWAAALAAGFLLTVLWYWLRARRAGVRTPARGYLITGIAATVLTVVLPPLTMHVHRLAILWAPFGDVWIRGTLGFLVIAAGLWVLARAERSRGLVIITALYTGVALVSSLYDVENILFRLGWNPGSSQFAWQLSGTLPDLLLPSAVLLIAGTGAFIVQHRRRPA